MSNIREIRPVEALFVYAEYGRTDMTDTLVSFRSYAKAAER